MFTSVFLRRWLVWPLGLATVASLALAYFLPAGGLFVNLAATFVGILFTVGYVDLVLKNHEAHRWEAALTRIQGRLDNFTGVAITQFRVAFRIPANVLDQALMVRGSDHERRTELVRLAQSFVMPAVEDGLRALDTQGWQRLVKQLQVTWTSADRLIELHGNQLGPAVIATLLDIQNTMTSIGTYFATFPDVLGTDPQDLKPNRLGQSTLPLQRDLLASAARDVRTTLASAIQLVQQSDGLFAKRGDA